MFNRYKKVVCYAMEDSKFGYQQFSLKKGSKIYFIGIGGISMSGLAELAKANGFIVAGSDRHLSSRTEYLAARGILIFENHDSARIDSFMPDLVVHTAAILPGNPEIQRALELGITTVDRAMFLGWLNRNYRNVINIAGTHGKTTTTAMCSLILMNSDQNPTVHLGAELIQFETTVRVGRPGDLMVSEACEYQRSFLKFYSTTAAVLNVDFDHVDCYSSLDEVIEVFADFSARVPADGYLILPAFDRNVRKMIAKIESYTPDSSMGHARIVWFGSAGDITPTGIKPDFYYDNLTFQNGLPAFDIYYCGSFYGHAKLGIPGRHNVLNALAAVACAHYNGADPVKAIEALNSFKGAEGRFTYTGSYHGAKVIADYAHHPAAAAATLEAAANIPHNHLWVVFQPLTFSRTQVLFDDYVNVLKGCEYVLFAEIFSDRESRRDYISSRNIAEEINRSGGKADFFKTFDEIVTKLDSMVGEGDLILFLGPEEIRGLADKITGRASFMDIKM
jgi:UDP-N-acetylmuramate--alanine ligase